MIVMAYRIYRYINFDKMNCQKFIENKIKEISKEKVILDVGGGKPFTKWLSSYKELFANSDYKTMDEMHRVLRHGGKMFFHVPSIYPYHAKKGFYPDYWRFFDDAIELLFKDFSKVECVKRGGYFKALLFFIPFQHRLRFVIDPLADFLDAVFKTERRTTTSGYYVFAIK